MKQSRKVIIALAPTGGWGPADGNPVTSDAIAADVINCVKAGASVVHLHARDGEGQLTTDLREYTKAVNTAKDSCDFILEASTGGLSSLTAAERIMSTTHPAAEMGSLNIGSLNFGDEVYKNSLPDVRYWIETLTSRGVKPSLEIFDTGHMETARDLINRGQIPLPCNFSFIFDVKWGMPWHPSILAYLTSRVPRGCNWGALLIGSADYSSHVAAAKAGATFVRAGFEDSFCYNGKKAMSNAELIRALRSELESAGFGIATVSEARAILLGGN